MTRRISEGQLTSLESHDGPVYRPEEFSDTVESTD